MWLTQSSILLSQWFTSPFSTVSQVAGDGGGGMSEEEQLLVVNRLHSILRPFMLRREKREVETDMPDKVEKIVRCALTESQRVLYESVLSGNVSLHNKMVQLRKI